MSLIDKNRQPSPWELRSFGLLQLVFFAVVGCIAWWRLDARTAARFIWGMSLAACALYYLAPRVQRPMLRAWTAAVYPIGWTVSHLMLAATYYLAITPIGLLARLAGYDPLHRRLDPSAPTYWTPRRAVATPRRYLQQF